MLGVNSVHFMNAKAIQQLEGKKKNEARRVREI